MRCALGGHLPEKGGSLGRSTPLLAGEAQDGGADEREIDVACAADIVERMCGLALRQMDLTSINRWVGQLWGTADPGGGGVFRRER